MDNYIAEISVLDKMLYNLYDKRDKQGYVRLSETIDRDCDWRNTARILYEKGYIEFPNNSTFYSLGRITQKGIDYIEKNYG